MKLCKQVSLALCASVVLVGMIVATSAQAATISWTVHDITGVVTDVSTNGTLVEAHSGADLGTGNVVDGTTFDINGVTFDDGYVFDSPSHLDTINARAGSGITGDYYTLLRYCDRNGSGSATFTFTNLTVSSQYEIQVWVSDNVGTAQEDGAVLNEGGTGDTPTPGTSGHVTLLREVLEGGPGQYALGTFTADSTTQQFLGRQYTSLTTTPATSGSIEVNGVQLRLISPYGVVLSNDNVSTNVAPGTLVGFLQGPAGTDAFVLTNAPAGGSNADNGKFQITEGTNLRTRVWMSQYSNDVSIAAVSNGTALVTNSLSVYVTAATSVVFRVAAEVSSLAHDGDIIGAMVVDNDDNATFSIIAGRTDLFTTDGSDNLVVTNMANWRTVGITNFVTIRAYSGASFSDLTIGAEVVLGIPSSTTFRFR